MVSVAAIIYCCEVSRLTKRHTTAYSAIVDFILALLPWKIIMSLQMKTHEKIGVAVAMSLGLLYVVSYYFEPFCVSIR